MRKINKKITKESGGTFKIITVKEFSGISRKELEDRLEKIDKIVNPEFALTEEAKKEQKEINEKEKKMIRDALEGRNAEAEFT